jgi:predicted DNA-binding protein with PD1-like motif
VHAHVTLADEDGRAFGGQLAEGAVVFASEFMIQKYQSEKTFIRHLDEESGLLLWPETRL